MVYKVERKEDRVLVRKLLPVGVEGNEEGIKPKWVTVVNLSGGVLKPLDGCGIAVGDATDDEILNAVTY